MFGKASIDAIAPSTCRPPWFETTSPSTPCSSAVRASRGSRIPLRRIGSRVSPLRNARKRRAKVREERAGIPVRELDQRADGAERDRSRLLRLAGALLGEADEDGVARILGDPTPECEGQECEVEIARPPAEERRVEGRHDRLAAARLGSPDEALDELVRGAPVELEPVRSIAERGGAAFHRNGRLVREDHRHALGAGGARDRQICVAVSELENADRGEQQRAVEPP
jgi:hypothetical protein